MGGFSGTTVFGLQGALRIENDLIDGRILVYSDGALSCHWLLQPVEERLCSGVER